LENIVLGLIEQLGVAPLFRALNGLLDIVKNALGDDDLAF